MWESSCGGSVHRAVLSLCVCVCVRAGGVHGDVGGAHNDRSSLLLLGTSSPLLSALDVLDGLKAEGKETNKKKTLRAAACVKLSALKFKTIILTMK